MKGQNFDIYKGVWDRGKEQESCQTNLDKWVTIQRRAVIGKYILLIATKDKTF